MERERLNKALGRCIFSPKSKNLSMNRKPTNKNSRKKIRIFIPIREMSSGVATPRTETKRIIPMTSSMTAAPKMVRPTSVFNFRISNNTRTGTPTDVATKINPITRPIFQEKPKMKEASIPKNRGVMTPPTATKTEGFFTFFRSEKFISSPDRNIKKRIPNSERKVNASDVYDNSGMCNGREKRKNVFPDIIPSPKPPSKRPANISPMTGGCFNLSKRYPNKRAKINARATENMISKISISSAVQVTPLLRGSDIGLLYNISELIDGE